jgi:hypothetical protein
MSASDKSYRLTAHDRLLLHGWRSARLLRDGADYDRLDIDALVASGDCFITLATTLDDCTRFLDRKDSVALPQIEKTISLLMYLQRHYRVVRKRSEYYQ